MITIRLTVTCLWALIILWATSAYAEEQRCTQLGANCVCSEQFNTNNLPVVQTFWKNPADSTTKECSTAGVAGGALEANDVNKITPRNTAEAMNALPAGHSLTWTIGGIDGHLGIFFAGNEFNSSSFTKRLAARFYIYHSQDFQFAQDGVCTNSKLMQFTGPNSLVDKSFGYIHMYNFTDFTPAQDCCFNGPGPDQGVIQKASWRGKWWRIEAVYTNRAGPGWVFKLYAKNVTDNGPELTVVDTSATGTQLNNPVSRTPPQRQDRMNINNYRETGCNGWLTMSHYMMAGWDTDGGQRIGAAREIEGGGDTVPPVSPTGLKVSSLWHWIMSLIEG